jgi:hypothetical protein
MVRSSSIFLKVVTIVILFLLLGAPTTDAEPICLQDGNGNRYEFVIDGSAVTGWTEPVNGPEAVPLYGSFVERFDQPGPDGFPFSGDETKVGHTLGFEANGSCSTDPPLNPIKATFIVGNGFVGTASFIAFRCNGSVFTYCNQPACDYSEVQFAPCGSAESLGSSSTDPMVDRPAHR